MHGTEDFKIFLLDMWPDQGQPFWLTNDQMISGILHQVVK